MNDTDATSLADFGTLDPFDELAREWLEQADAPHIRQLRRNMDGPGRARHWC